MPDLLDGESVEVQGSSRTPYVLKNVGGVYSCSCPAWRNQSLPIDRRSCKHLRNWRGDEAERRRLGQLELLPPTKVPAADKQVPALLLAQTWNESIEPKGWWLSEKLDGVRCYYDGTFRSRQGNVFHAPTWFRQSLPNVPLDGELWLARKAFQRTVSIVRRQDETDLWRQIRFVVFDAPAVHGPFETRLAFLDATFREHQPPFARVLAQQRCQGIAHLERTLGQIEAQGGEGLMLRQPGSAYEPGRSATLLKVKSMQELDVRVVEHLPGTGRHRGRLGALQVRMTNGKGFAVGSGLTDAQRNSPPSIGSLITVRYQELTDSGIPRFPTFVRVRCDVT